MARVYVSIGSNIDAEANIRAAINALRQHYSKLTISTVYESEAVGFAGDNFLNLVVGFDAHEDIFAVAKTLRQIEDNHARDRKGPRFSARTIDLDLLLYDDVVMNDHGLNVPRDEITENAFVLQPLAEVAGNIKHPVLERSIAEIWQDYDKDRQVLWAIKFSWAK